MSRPVRGPGRPALPGGPGETKVRLGGDRKAAAEQAADRDGIDLAKWFRQMVDRTIEPLLAAAADMGLPEGWTAELRHHPEGGVLDIRAQHRTHYLTPAPEGRWSVRHYDIGDDIVVTSAEAGITYLVEETERRDRHDRLSGDPASTGWGRLE